MPKSTDAQVPNIKWCRTTHIQFLKLSYQWNDISRISKNINKICSRCFWLLNSWFGYIRHSPPPGYRAEITVTHMYRTFYWDVIQLVIKYNKSPKCRSFSRFAVRETLAWAHRFLSWIPRRLIHEPQGVCLWSLRSYMRNCSVCAFS